MSNKDISINEAIANLAEALSVSNVKDLPGCWECKVDDRWWFAINAHTTPKAVKLSPSGVAHKVDPFHCYVEFNGWPAGVFHLAGGGEFAQGTEANEDAFIDALVAAAERARRKS